MKRISLLVIPMAIAGALIAFSLAQQIPGTQPALAPAQANTVVWVVDLSTFQTLGSDWISPPTPIPDNFRYEPWESLLELLNRVWTESDKCHILVGFVSGPNAQSVFRGPPCLDPPEAIEALRRHGPAGWYEFSVDLILGVRYAQSLPRSTIFVVSRGPLDPLDDKVAGIVANKIATQGTSINVVPMGNEPSSVWRFPNLAGLSRLAETTGGRVYYYPPPADIHDYSALPSSVANQILTDLGSH